MAELNTHGSWWWNLLDNNELSIAIITIAIFAIFWYKFTFSRQSPPLPPGPRSLPIVGYLPFLTPDLHKQFSVMGQSYGPIFKFNVGKKVHVVINNSDIAKEVVRDQDGAFANRSATIAGAVFTYGGTDIVFSNSAYWRNLRKILVHEVLSNKNLDASSFYRTDEVRKTVKKVFSKVGTAIDVGVVSSATSLNVITNMISGSTFDDRLKVKLSSLVPKISEYFAKPNVSDIFPSLAWFDIQGIERGMRKQHIELDKIISSIIDSRSESKSKLDDGRKDFLEVLLELKDEKKLDVTQVKALILDFVIGGTETTTTMVEWAMTLIIKHRNVMKKIQDELAEVVGINNTVEESHLPKLNYLDATIRETFRLYPAGAILLPRSPSRDCVVAGYTIPKDATVLVNAWAIQRDPEYWDNPMEFNPERFLISDGSKKWDFRGTNINFMPFGAGRRSCPGLPLAEKMQMYILASLLHSFDWNLPEGVKDDLSESLGISLKKTNPLIAIPTQRLPNSSLYM